MLTPLQRPRAPRRQVSKIKNYPAPVGGWVADSSAQSVEINTARILTNMVPTQNSAYVRKGCFTISNLGNVVRTITDYDNGAVKKLIAAAGDAVYEVLTDDDSLYNAPILIDDGFSSSEWECVMMSNAADDTYLVMVNGQDGIWTYDGSVMAEAPASAANQTVNNITSFKARLWFTKENDPSIYYGEVLSANPLTLTEFPIGALLRKGGYIVAIDSLSVDGGSGPDDYLVAVSSRGEIIVYAGIDPASDFQLVGVFAAGNPLSKRCLTKSGSDLLYYSSNGPQLLSRLFSLNEGLNSIKIPIRSEFEAVISQNSALFGWEIINYNKRGWVLFNVPMLNTNIIHQFALNLESQAWFRIVGWNGLCWTVHNKKLYFGDAVGNVKIADYGESDDDVEIDFDYMQSWSQYESVARKKFNMAQVTIKANSAPKIAVDMNVDYQETTPLSVPGFAPSVTVTPWDTSPWDISPWTASQIYYVNSFGLSNLGYVGALRYRGKLKNTTHELFGFRIAFEEGSFL